jgi:sialate O-acetylesterase
MPKKLAFLVVAFLAVFIQGYSQEKGQGFAVHKVFDDHMVLQRQKPITISGTAKPGEIVNVTVGKNTSRAVTGKDSKWAATLPAMQAGGPYEVRVKNSANKEIVLNDVLIGEVWMCSGQSNMQMPVYSGRAFWSSVNGEEEVKNANYPKIRLYNTQRTKAPKGPCEEIVGPGWQVCSPETVAQFSAAGYYFGRQLYKDLNIPIGLVNSSWGGTPIESWISKEGYSIAGRNKELNKIATAYKTPEEKKKALEKAEAFFNAWFKRFNDFDKAKTKQAENWKNTDFDDSSWDKARAGSPFPYNIDGVVWYRKTVNIPPAWQGKELVLSLGMVDDCDETFLNGQKVGSTSTDTKKYWSHRRIYKIPGNMVKPGKAVIAIRVSDYFSNGGLMGPANLLKIFPENDKNAALPLVDGWKSKVEFAVDFKKIGQRPNVGGNGTDSPHFPSTLYNGMIAPWTVFPMRGFIWYQGESNAGRFEDYMKLHPLLVKDWRRLWKDPDFAFIFVQLAAYQKHTPKKRLADDFWADRKPKDPAWAKLREVQTATLNVPNTGMAVSIDIGDHSDIHPADKQTVGYRLAREAERICYGKKDVSAGPLYEKMKIEDGKIRLFFENAGSGLVAKNGELEEFAIAGSDGKFVWAKAAIDENSVLVWSNKISAPKTVRYAWSRYPLKPNLYNKEGFAASPFRTDQPDYLLKK